MEFPEDPIDSAIEEIATFLAIGYLRLRKAETVSESPAPAAPETTGDRLDSAPGKSPS